MCKKCLKCDYVRQPTDTASEFACPSCGAIYAKVEAVMEQKADASFVQITPQYWNVTIHKDGKAERAILGQMFTTHGPYSVLGLRLDRLIKAEILRDASTITSQAKSDGVATTSVAGQIGRGVVGGVIAGPAGAIIGGSGASQKIETNTTTHQTRNVDIYMALFFKGAESIVVEVFDESAFKLLMASVGQQEWSQSQIDAAMQKAKAYDEWERRKHAQDAQKGAKSRDLQARIVKLLIGFFALLFLVNYGTEKYNDYVVSKLISDGKFDKALQKTGKDSDKRKEVAEIILQNRKALLTGSLGSGAGKTAGELRSFIEANFPDAVLSSPTDIKVRIGDEWYRLYIRSSEVGGVSHYRLSSIQPTLSPSEAARASDEPSTSSSTTSSSSTSSPDVVTCDSLMNYARNARGDSFMTALAVVDEARKKGTCK